jgi:hypothetical protein
VKRLLPPLLALAAVALPAAGDFGVPPEVKYDNVPYNGRFTFNRLRFKPSRWGPGNYLWGLDLKWNHDYPRAEQHLMKILKETTTLDPNLEGNIYALDEPELFSHPIAYLSEPGYWTMTEKEAASLRAYLLKGGFLILDDFVAFQWDNFVEQMRVLLPQHRLVELDGSHPIFDSFFRIDPKNFGHPYLRGYPPGYWGVFEDNDPSKRLMLIANYNHDIGEYWEWSDTGFVPIDLSNEAYKLGVNYIIYAMTH